MFMRVRLDHSSATEDLQMKRLHSPRQTPMTAEAHLERRVANLALGDGTRAESVGTHTLAAIGRNSPTQTTDVVRPLPTYPPTSSTRTCLKRRAPYEHIPSEMGELFLETPPLRGNWSCPKACNKSFAIYESEGSETITKSNETITSGTIVADESADRALFRNRGPFLPPEDAFARMSHGHFRRRLMPRLPNNSAPSFNVEESDLRSRLSPLSVHTPADLTNFVRLPTAFVNNAFEPNELTLGGAKIPLSRVSTVTEDDLQEIRGHFPSLDEDLPTGFSLKMRGTGGHNHLEEM